MKKTIKIDTEGKARMVGIQASIESGKALDAPKAEIIKPRTSPFGTRNKN